MFKRRLSTGLLLAALGLGCGLGSGLGSGVSAVAFADSEEVVKTPAQQQVRRYPRYPDHTNERMTNPDFPTLMRPEPDSMQSKGKIPPGTSVTIVDMRVIQVDRFKENWYLVEYDGVSGWVRGDDLDGEISEKKYSVTYQAPEVPGNSSVGGVSF